MIGQGKTVRVILSLISVTYINADILLICRTEDKNTFPCYYCYTIYIPKPTE